MYGEHPKLFDYMDNIWAASKILTQTVLKCEYVSQIIRNAISMRLNWLLFFLN